MIMMMMMMMTFSHYLISLTLKPRGHKMLCMPWQIGARDGLTKGVLGRGVYCAYHSPDIQSQPNINTESKMFLTFSDIAFVNTFFLSSHCFLSPKS